MCAHEDPGAASLLHVNGVSEPKQTSWVLLPSKLCLETWLLSQKESLADAEEGSLSWRISQEAESSTSRGLRLAKRLSELYDSSFISGRCKEHDEYDRPVPVANAAFHPAGGRRRDCACQMQGAPAVTLPAGARVSPRCLYLCISD